MITNRTQSDVEQAILLIETKVKKFIELSEEELDILERGTLTISTLNRIESKQQQLKELINGIGYWSINIQNKSWTYSDIFNENELPRIIENIKNLKDGFFVYSYTPQIPDAKYYFSNINDMEKILCDLENMVEDIKNNYRECGAVETGEDL